jgi:uncharacterized protein (TIRG00374 family)
MLVGLVVSGVLGILLIRVVDVSSVMKAIAGADRATVAAAIAMYILSIWVRSLVWGRLLPSSVPAVTLFRITAIGVAVNYVTPLRMGEIARTYLLARWCNVAYGMTIVSLVSERVLDGVALSLLLLVALLFIPAPAYVLGLGIAVGAAFAVLVGTLVFAAKRTDSASAAGGRLMHYAPDALRAPLTRLGSSLASGLEPLRNWRRLPALLALAVLGWLCQFSVFYLLTRAIGIPASLPVSVIAGSVSILSTMLPSGPGFVGTFDATLVKIMIDMQGVALETAASYTFLVHAVLTIPIVIVAAGLLWGTDLSLGQVLGRQTRSSPVGSDMLQHSLHALSEPVSAIKRAALNLND